MTTLPSRLEPISPAIWPIDWAGTARTTTSASAAAVALLVPAVAPVWLAASVACSGCAAVIVTSCPARVRDAGEGAADVAGTDDGDLHGVDPPGS